MEQQLNPYQGIAFCPVAERYSVSVNGHRIGSFPSLELAVDARRRRLEHLSDRAMDRTTTHPITETRTASWQPK